MQEKLNVVFASDENYLQHFTVALSSLLENNKQYIGRVFLVNEMDCTEKLNEIKNFYYEKYGVTVENIRVNGADFDGFKILTHVSKAAYFRLILDKIIPAEINSILYLDCDIVVNDDISDILKLNFSSANSQYLLYAVDHKLPEASLASYPQDGPVNYREYFNSGVLYLNLSAMRQLKSSQDLLLIAAEKMQAIIFEDQDVLNLYFYRKWGTLDYTYNAWQWSHPEYTPSNPPKIVHYTTINKPWHLDNRNIFRYLYWHYLKNTPFANAIATDKYQDAVKRFVLKRCRDTIRSRVLSASKGNQSNK